ncbi:MAG: CvpA family protein [Syntrophomonadaceae bacterium]|nr:CvpA family protein [Syntrophomonadaceae bacterium]
MQLNPVDYIIIAVLLLSLVAGYRQGMVGAVSGVLGFIVGLALAAIFYHALAEWADQYWGISAILADWIRIKFPLAALAPDNSLLNLDQLDTIYNDAASYLAGNLLLILSFLLILFIGSKAVQFFSRGINSLLDGTIFSGVNRGLGAAVVMVKNLLIMAVVLGLIMPSLDLGSQMGLSSASAMNGYVSGSLLVEWLLQWFEFFKGLVT